MECQTRLTLCHTDKSHIKHVVICPIDHRSTGSRGQLTPPHFSSGGQRIHFDPPLLTCIKHVYCHVWVTIMYHQSHSLCVHYAHNIDTFMLGLTIPVMSATAERSFSALRTLKTFSRSTMNTSRLMHLALLHFHQDRTDKMNLNDLYQTFVSSTGR